MINYHNTIIIHQIIHKISYNMYCNNLFVTLCIKRKSKNKKADNTPNNISCSVRTLSIGYT